MGAFTYSKIGMDLFLRENPEIKLTLLEKSVFGELCNFANQNGVCYPKVKTIAEKAGCCIRSVQKAFITLLNKGLIIKTSQFNVKTGRQKQNFYVVNLDASRMEEISELNRKQMLKDAEQREYQKNKNKIIKERVKAKAERLDMEKLLKTEELKAKKAAVRKEIESLKAKYNKYKNSALQMKIKLFMIKNYIENMKIAKSELKSRHKFLSKHISEYNTEISKDFNICRGELYSPPEKNISYCLLKRKKLNIKYNILKTNNLKRRCKKMSNERNYKHITKLDERQLIEKMILENREITEIAKAIGVSVSAIYREIKRGKITEERGSYSALEAQKKHEAGFKNTVEASKSYYKKRRVDKKQIEKRQLIEKMILENRKIPEIAKTIGVSISTIYREIRK